MFTRWAEGPPRIDTGFAQNGEIVQQRFVEISVKGEIDAASLMEFDGVTAITDRGVTRLRLGVRDDSALYGLLAQLEATGLEVLAVYPYPDPTPSSPADLSPGDR